MGQPAERQDGAKAAEGSQLQRVERELLSASQELHRLHREAAELREQLQVERSQREELFTLVSHELRTPITVISGYSRLLLTGEPGPLTEEQQRFLGESVKACRKLDGLVANLLESCRGGDGSHVLEVCTASLAPPGAS